ncbi:vesicle coat component, partial [Kappamyces sp. JEL0680]
MEAFSDDLCNWRLVLSMILANRSSEDSGFLSEYSDFLMAQGEIDASQLCFMLSSPSILSSSQLERISLILGNSRLHPCTFHKDQIALRATEIYEAAAMASNGGSATATPLPHFQAYKLYNIALLADLGLITEATGYLQSVSLLAKGFAPACPFLHGFFWDRLQEINDRLRISCNVVFNKSLKNASGSGWLSSFSGAAIGRGLEQLMHSAVGVDGDSAEAVKTPSSLFMVPIVDVKPDMSHSVPTADHQPTPIYDQSFYPADTHTAPPLGSFSASEQPYAPDQGYAENFAHDEGLGYGEYDHEQYGHEQYGHEQY